MDEPPPVAETAKDEDEVRFGHLRAEPRDSMFLLATIRRQNRPEVPVKVRNLSGGGLMAETPSGFLRGEPIEIELRGIGPVTGKVAWVATGKVGISFDWPIDPKLARKPATSEPQRALVKTSAVYWRPGLR